MKRSEYKVTTLDVLRVLADGPQFAENVGAACWPDKIGFGPSRGGPASVAVSASYMLGRLRKSGLVEQSLDRRVSNYARWSLTTKGQEYLQEHDNKLPEAC